MAFRSYLFIFLTGTLNLWTLWCIKIKEIEHSNSEAGYQWSRVMSKSFWSCTLKNLYPPDIVKILTFYNLQTILRKWQNHSKILLKIICIHIETEQSHLSSKLSSLLPFQRQYSLCINTGISRIVWPIWTMKSVLCWI